jgi:hypothetical protein
MTTPPPDQPAKHSRSLTGFSFVDCLLLDIQADVHMKTFGLVLEAWPVQGGASSPGKVLLKIECAELTEFKADFQPEFREDLAKPYDINGSDYKANELSLIALEEGPSGCMTLAVRSDMLSADICCRSVQVTPVGSSLRSLRPGG